MVGLHMLVVHVNSSIIHRACLVVRPVSIFGIQNLQVLLKIFVCYLSQIACELFSRLSISFLHCGKEICVDGGKTLTTNDIPAWIVNRYALIHTAIASILYGGAHVAAVVGTEVIVGAASVYGIVEVLVIACSECVLQRCQIGFIVAVVSNAQFGFVVNV